MAASISLPSRAGKPAVEDGIAGHPRRWAAQTGSASSRQEGGKAAITGDFLVHRRRGQSAHSRAAKGRHRGHCNSTVHMLTEQPRMFFIHFWAK